MLEKVPGNFKIKYVENCIQCDFGLKDMTQNHCCVPWTKGGKRGPGYE